MRRGRFALSYPRQSPPVIFVKKKVTDMKLSNNLVVQIASLVLWVFALAGLEIDPQATGEKLVTNIVTQNWPLLVIVVINLGNSIFSWIKTWKTDKPNLIQFLRSPNWWISFCNILFAILAMRGIHVPEGASAQIVDYIFQGQWWSLLGYLIPNVLGPVIRALTAKPAPVQG